MNFVTSSQTKPKQDLIKFIDINECSNDSTYDINLLDHQSFNPVSFL